MRNNSKPSFRHELKFLMSKAEGELLKQRLNLVLDRDAYAKNGRYMIRSLYFDDREESAYEDKLSGVESRKKYRIRFYDGNDSMIKLERKRKEGQYIQKVSARLTKCEMDELMAGRYDFLHRRKESLCRDFYAECVVNGMKPAVIVDYDREPYVYPYGDVRITFDSNIRAGFKTSDPFDMHMPFMDVIDRGLLILEVKYTQYLPEIIRDLLPVNRSIQMAYSKYTMCLEMRKEF